MKKLVEGPTLLVYPSLALKVGLHEAIFLQQLYYKLQFSQTVVESYKWYQCTIDNWQLQLPFLSKSTVERTIKSLCTMQLIERKGFDGRGTYYRIRHEMLQEMLVVDSASYRSARQIDSNHASTCRTIVPQTDGKGTSNWSAELAKNPCVLTADEALRSKERIIKESKDVLLYVKAIGGQWRVDEGQVFQVVYAALKNGADIVKLLQGIRKACQQQLPLNPQEIIGDVYA